MRLTLIAATALPLFVGTLAADTLTLRNGQTIQGTYLGGSAREIRMDLGDHVQTYPLDQISNVQFDSGAAPQASISGPANAAPQGNYPENAGPQPAANAPLGITVPANTVVTVRMIDAVDSDSSSLGRTYRASIDEPVLVNGQTVIPRGADVVTKIVEDQQSGKIEGRTSVGLALQTITINGQPVDVTSQQVTKASGSRGERSAKVIGGTAVLGTILGAVAGGGRGAAIGAASGAAVGTGAEAVTHGQRVRIPAESRLNFTLTYPVNL